MVCSALARLRFQVWTQCGRPSPPRPLVLVSTRWQRRSRPTAVKALGRGARGRLRRRHLRLSLGAHGGGGRSSRWCCWRGQAQALGRHHAPRQRGAHGRHGEGGFRTRWEWEGRWLFISGRVTVVYLKFLNIRSICIQRQLKKFMLWPNVSSGNNLAFNC